MMKKITVLLSMLLLAAATVFAQGRGGGQGKGGGQGQSQGQGQGQAQGQGQGQGQGQDSVQAGGGNTEQKHVRVTTQQRNQIHTCDQQANKIRTQARKLAQTPAKKFNANEARGQSQQIQDQIRAMEQEHERLMNGFDGSQQQAWQEQIQNTNRLRQQANSQMQQLNSELSSANPDSVRVAERARELERTMETWRKQYQEIYSQGQP